MVRYDSPLIVVGTGLSDSTSGGVVATSALSPPDDNVKTATTPATAAATLDLEFGHITRTLARPGAFLNVAKRTVGVVVASASFGIGHLLQGVDAAIATALLGAFWGIVYLRRRSVVAPMVSHSGFDLLQVAQFMATGR